MNIERSGDPYDQTRRTRLRNPLLMVGFVGWLGVGASHRWTVFRVEGEPKMDASPTMEADAPLRTNAMNPSDLIALANRLPYLEYSGPAFQKVQAQFPGAVGKDAADHVIDCIIQLRAENAELREENESMRGENARLNAECGRLNRDNAIIRRRLSEWE